MQAELLAGLINGFAVSIQSGIQPGFTASSDQKRCLSLEAALRVNSTLVWTALCVGQQEIMIWLSSKLKNTSDPAGQTDLTRKFTKATHDQVRRQETAEITALAYEHRAKFREIAKEKEDGKYAAQLLFSLNEKEFHLTIAEMPIKWLDYISSSESQV